MPLIPIGHQQKLREIARDDFSKLTDPFVPQARYPINIRYNDQPVDIPRFDSILFDFAHADVDAEYSVKSGEPKFVGHVNYRTEHRDTTFELNKADMLGICKLECARGSPVAWTLFP